MDIPTYILENLSFYIIAAVTLLLWDVIDLYIELRDFRFLGNRSFGAYYSIRAFFSIAIMEIALIVGLLKLESKAVVAFIVPLIFAIVLDNLVVQVGGTETKSLDFSQIFDRFRYTVLESLKRKDEATKVRSEMRLLNSAITDDELLDYSKFYLSDDEMKTLTENIKNLQPRAKRLELIKWLVSRTKTKDIDKALQPSRVLPKKQPLSPKT